MNDTSKKMAGYEYLLAYKLTVPIYDLTMEFVKKYIPSNFPSLPTGPTRAVNLLITLIQQANFLIDKLIESLKEKHTKEGGFNESLFN